MASIRELIRNVPASARKKPATGQPAEPFASLDQHLTGDWISIEEICSGEWHIGGRSTTTEPLRALVAGQ
jgi:hypothetical protein